MDEHEQAKSPVNPPPEKCSRCGGRLPEQPLPGNVCPQCLLQLGIGDRSLNGDEFPGVGPETSSSNEVATAPEHIGPYRLLEKLGEGGMGVVYLAEQDRPLRRRVAIKLVKLGLDTREVLARFESERQVLALMNHQGIAKVFDAGSTERGRPYFVMEFVAGPPVTEFCDREQLDLHARLELFIQICEAVQHAHQKGIIHRDIKPSNVLVELQDGKPCPKVIDFGVAKATSQRLTERTLFTQHGVLIGTPAYMSPEQSEINVLDVDTRTDIYSLGVLLYELLVGLTPYDSGMLRAAGFERMLQIIREQEPPTPSERLVKAAAEATSLALRRRSDLETLLRHMRNDLDWIAMKAIEKDRARRYASASEFAADIRRHLNDEPVVAGPPSTRYRMRKFLRRNYIGVRIGAAGIVLVLGFAAAMILQATRVARERDRAQLEAKRVRLEGEALRYAIMDGPLDQVLSRFREAMELHHRIAQKDQRELLLHIINQLYVMDEIESLQDPHASELIAFVEELEAEALMLIQEAVARGDISFLESVDLLIKRLGQRRGVTGTRWLEQKPKELEQLYRGALALRRAANERGSPELIRSLNALAQNLQNRAADDLRAGRAPKAESLAREALDLLLESRDHDLDRGGWGFKPQVAGAEGLLGECLVALGRYEEAEPLLIRSFEMLNSREALLRLVHLHEVRGQMEQANAYREKLLVESVRDLGPIMTRRDLGYSALFEGRSIWLFGDTFSADGMLSNTSAWTNDLNAEDGIVLHDATFPQEFLPFSADETTFNQANRKSSRRWALWPGPIVVDPDRKRALVVYSKVLASGVGLSNFDDVGHSIAVWPHPDSAVVRPKLRPETQYPHLLFQGEEPRFGAGAVVYANNLYLFTARIVARAPLAKVLDRDAWRFYSGKGWVADWRLAITTLEASHQLTVHWNQHLHKFLAVYGTPLGNGIEIRTADRPEGPWSPRRVILQGLPPDRMWNYSVIAHPEFARSGGRVEYISYYRPWGFNSEIRLIEVTFF